MPNTKEKTMPTNVEENNQLASEKVQCEANDNATNAAKEGAQQQTKASNSKNSNAKELGKKAVSKTSKAVANHGLMRNWFTIVSLVGKDFKLKYRRSVLGVLWSVLNPLLMMLVLAAVFTNVLKFGDIPNFPMYLILGNVLFQLMSDSTTEAMSSILSSGPLIKKIRISKMIFPLEKVLFQLVNFAISLIAVIIVMVVFQIPPTIYLLALPLLLIYMLLFCAGLGMLLSALAVFFRDVCHLWGVVITAWTYATPLFYPVTLLPDWMQKAEVFNPMFHYVNYFRDIAMYGVWPGGRENLICLGIAFITFLVGFFVFKRMEKKFILYV